MSFFIVSNFHLFWVNDTFKVEGDLLKSCSKAVILNWITYFNIGSYSQILNGLTYVLTFVGFYKAKLLTVWQIDTWKSD